jgi:hypothetical protein
MHEKRRETRRAANGNVRVKFTNPEPLEIDGTLMDVSPSGFRMVHGCVSLCSGQMVDFTHMEATGRARVIWNRILAGGVESGFLVCSN